MRPFRTVQLCTVVATSVVALTGGASLAAARPAAVGGEASVSFPLALSSGAQARIAALARTTGRGAERAAAVRALAPPAARAGAVRAWANRNGFTVVHSSPWLVEVRGPATDLALALGTGVAARNGRGRSYAVATGPLHVPLALAGLVTTPVGLDERPRFRHQSFGGGDVQNLEDLPVRGSGAGADVTVGTLNLSGWHPSDLTEYAGSYGLRAPVVQSVVVGSGHVVATAADDSDGGQGEVALDAEAIAGTAPAATQRMYFGANSDADYLALLSRMADDATAGLLQVASTSWGVCENAVPSSELAAESAQIDRMVAAGATFFAASGDSGAYACSTPSSPDSTPAVDWPAAEASTVGVGGTSVTGNAQVGYGAPTAWSLAGASGAYLGSGSGGGCSAYVPAPAYQTAGLCPSRSVPDMAALADPGTGYTVYDSVDGWTVAGGTSLASPVAAAGLAVYLSSQADRHGVGNILGVAYRNPGAFTDVTSGSNGAWSAQPGYDLVTGLGVPDWRTLGAAIRGVAPDAVRPASSNPFFAAPTAWNSLDVPFAVDRNGGSLTSPAVRQTGDRTCPAAPGLSVDPTHGTFALAAGTPDGPVTTTFTATDPSMGCRTTTRSVFLDRRVPSALASVISTGATSPRFSLAWAFADPAPSSGSDGFSVKVTDVTTRAVRLNLGWTTLRSVVLTGLPGHRYVLQVTSWDRAGNRSPLRSLGFAQYDDRSVSASRGWTRVGNRADFSGSHLQTSQKGAYFLFRFTGRSLTAGVLTSRYGGYADVYVDGVRRFRTSLYATATHYRQQLRLAAFRVPGTHYVVVKVVGAHPRGSSGNYVYLDSLTVL